jgi:outer membrane protein assembly factor BamB
MPEALFPLYMAFQITAMIALLIIAIWFFFLSGLRLVTKLAVVLILAGLVGTLIGVTRRVEFSGMMAPVLIYRWQPDIAAEFDERLARAPTSVPVLTVADLTIAPGDFPRYRGPAADGVAAPAPIATNWSDTEPRVVWRTPVGWSYSGIAVAGNVAITIEQRGDDEVIACYDRNTGEERWAHGYRAKFEQAPPMGGNGPRSTPTIAEGDVYSLGAKGDLVCLDGTSGKERWAVNIVTDNGAKVVQWGMTSSPLIVGDRVIVNAGIDPDNNQQHAVAAYDRKTGKKLWATGSHAAGYSSPMLATFADVPQVVLFDAGGLVGIDPANGAELWRCAWTTQFDMNIIQPVLLPNNRVFISSEQTNGGAVLEVKQSEGGWWVTQVWSNRHLVARFANPVYRAGHLYGLSGGSLCCLDAMTGKRLWKSEGGFDSGQLLVTGDTLIVQAERTGELVAVAADPAEHRELGRTKVFRGSRTWNTPSMAGGRLYVRNHEEMLCLEPAKLSVAQQK